MKLQLRAILGVFGVVMTLVSAFTGLTLLSRHGEGNAKTWIPLEMTPPKQLEIAAVRQGTSATFEVIVQNVSGEDIRVEHLSASCGCTDVQIDKSDVPVAGRTQIRGEIRSTSSENAKGAMITMGVLGMESGRMTTMTYHVSAKFYSTIRFQPKFHEGVEIPETNDYDIGGITFESVGENNATIEIVSGSFSPDFVKMIPEHITLNPGNSVFVAVRTPRMNETRGFLRIRVDDGREEHLVPLLVLMEDSVTVTPKILVLGHIRVSEGLAEPTFPASVKLRGKSLGVNSVVVRETPAVIKHVTSVKHSSNEIELICELAMPNPEPHTFGSILLDVVSPDNEVLQSVKVPVVGAYDLVP